MRFIRFNGNRIFTLKVIFYLININRRIKNHRRYGLILLLRLNKHKIAGYALMNRLLFVADSCPPMRKEALLMLINYVVEVFFSF